MKWDGILAKLIIFMANPKLKQIDTRELNMGWHIKIPLENRICKLLELNEVEDETHFMIRCPYESELSGKMMSNIADALSVNVDNFSEKDNF